MNDNEIVQILQKANEAIETLQGAYEVMSALADVRKEEIESLQAQLAASQRRERAAVEFIKYLDRNYSGYMAEDERFAEWRGPQAGEGGKDG